MRLSGRQAGWLAGRMEISRIDERGEYTFTADVSGVDDLKTNGTWTIRPDKVALVYRWDGVRPWYLWDARVYGARVLKGDRIGKERGDRGWYSGQERPAWLRQLSAAHRPTDRDQLAADHG